MTRSFAFRLALLAFLACWIQHGLAAEQILRYDSVVEVHADGHLDVTEHITVRAEGRNIRRGIFRDFPTRYKDRHGNRVRVDLTVLGVERDGQTEAWFTEKMSNGVRINTGDDRFLRVPADYRFTIRYQTTRQLGFFSEHDELYWNAIGTGWDFSIAAGSVEVRLPQAVPVEDMRLDVYTGPQGAQRSEARVQSVTPGVVRWELTQPLKPREGMTIALGFPKGLVAKPSGLQKLRWLLRDNRGILIMLVGLVVLLTYCYRRWNAVGRDPLPGAIYARYDPPEGFSPAELRLMQKYSYDNRGFSADLLNLAVDGCLTISSEAVKRSEKWRIKQVPGRSTSHEASRTLLNALFSLSGEELELEQKNVRILQAAKQGHEKALLKRFEPVYFNRHHGSSFTAVGITSVFLLIGYGLSGGSGLPIIIGLSILMFIINIVFSHLVQAPTAEGRRLLDTIEGLKMYLSVAEKDDLSTLRGPDEQAPEMDAKRYERLLPYAVALEVEDAWTRKFTLAVGATAAAAAAGSIAWYKGHKGGNLGDMTRAIGSSLTSHIASASTPPGSSSGGGGGGSSGGGGGGGGGGGR